MARFDIPHLGHAIFLYQAARLGDFLVVGVSTDEYAKSQGKKTVYSYKERYALLTKLPFVDQVLPNNKASMRDAIEIVKPNIVVIGSDWGDDYFDQIDCSPIWLALNKVQMIFIPHTKEISTTDIKKRLK